MLFGAPDGSIRLDVRLEQETVWLDLNQIAALFERDKSVISRHLRNIFGSGELLRPAVVARNATTAADGKTYQVESFNLDAILSVGFRVNSRRGTQFRIWASQVLREHLLRGYTVNQLRLDQLNQAIRLIASTADRQDLSGDEALALLRVVGEYSLALDLLDDYDHQRVAAARAGGQLVHPLGTEEALRIVERLRERFGPGVLVGRLRGDGLDSALGAVMQSFDGQDLYPSLEEKAAHLLYFLVKNHPFVDVNKRIGAALFLWFLEKNGALSRRGGERRVSHLRYRVGRPDSANGREPARGQGGRGADRDALAAGAGDIASRVRNTICPGRSSDEGLPHQRLLERRGRELHRGHP